MSASVRGFIFDLDGVLTDTAELHYRAWKRLADEEGIPFTREDNEALRGVSRRESLERLLRGRPIGEAEAEELMARKNAYYLESLALISPADLLPGVDSLLSEMRAAGLKIAVASASRNAARVVDALGLGARIDALCDGHSVQRQKPAPDLFLFAAGRIGLEPPACVVVEDSAAGITAARAAGMRCVGIGPPQRVGQADVVLPDLANIRLEELLKRLAG